MAATQVLLARVTWPSVGAQIPTAVLGERNLSQLSQQLHVVRRFDVHALEGADEAAHNSDALFIGDAGLLGLESAGLKLLNTVLRFEGWHTNKNQSQQLYTYMAGNMHCSLHC